MGPITADFDTPVLTQHGTAIRSSGTAIRFVPGTALHSILRVGAAFGIDASAVFAFADLPVDLAALGDT